MPPQEEAGSSSDFMGCAPMCYLSDSETVKDTLGYGRIPGAWWTLNHRYNYDHEVHRLNVKDPDATLRALLKETSESRRHRFDFVRDAPDIVTQMHALRSELNMKMVMPAVLGSSESYPYLPFGRYETGPGGHGHFHGVSYAVRNPRMDGVKEESVLEAEAVAKGLGASNDSPVELNGVDGSKSPEAADAGVSSGDESGGEEPEGDVGDESETTAPQRRGFKSGLTVRGHGGIDDADDVVLDVDCLLYTSPSPRDS